MKGFQPPRPAGTTREARFDQWVWDVLTRLRFINTSTVSWDERTTGFAATAKQVGGGPGGLLGPFQIDSVQGDYLTCYAYDPASDTRTGTSPVYIAKEYKHQNSLTTETIFGVIHNYTYQDGTDPPGGLAAADAGNVFRIDNFGASVEYQQITPPWVYGDEGEIVFANQAATSVEGPNGLITLLVAGRSCQWGAVE